MAGLEKHKCALHPERPHTGEAVSPPSRFPSLVTGIHGNVKGALGSAAGRLVPRCWEALAGSQLAGLLPAAVGPDGRECRGLALGKRWHGQPSPADSGHEPSCQSSVPGFSPVVQSRAVVWVQDIVYFAQKWGQVGIFSIRVSCNFHQLAFIVRDV